MKDINSLLISTLAMAITAGTLAEPAITAGADLSDMRISGMETADAQKPDKGTACALALTELSAD